MKRLALLALLPILVLAGAAPAVAQRSESRCTVPRVAGEMRTETVRFDGVTMGIEDKGRLVEAGQLFEWVGVSGRVNWPRAPPGRLAVRDQGSARVTVFAAPMNDQRVPT